MTCESRRALEPICALDPLLLIPRIEYANEVYEFVLSQPKAYCLVILDMKNFHSVNDIYGYDIGDNVIDHFMRRLRARLPAGSVSIRFRHGDEFLFFVPLVLAQAEALFRSFLETCDAAPALTVGHEDIFVSYRFAVIDLVPKEPVKALLVRAEKALRAVKGQGTPRT